MAYNTFIPMYIRRTEARRTRSLVTAAEWNELFNLNIEQGDHSEEYLNDLCQYLFGADGQSGFLEGLNTRVQASDRLVPLFEGINSIGPVVNDEHRLCTAKDILEAMGAAGLGDMLKAYYDPNNNGDKVAKAEDADSLGGLPAADYMQYADLDAEPTEDSTGGATSGGTKTYIDRHDVNRNLLDNPMFKIDQRQGYVVPPNTPFTTDGGQTYSETTDKYYTVTRLVDIGGAIVPYFIYNGNEVNAAGNTAVRGYTGVNGYMSDMWRNVEYQSGTVLILDNGIRLVRSDNSGYFGYMQYIPKSEFEVGETITISALTNKGVITATGVVSTSASIVYQELTDGFTIGFGQSLMQPNDYWRFDVYQRAHGLSPTVDMEAYAVKLEHGSISTLQAEMNSGAYNEGLDLWKCRERLQIFDFPINSTLGATLGATSWVNTQLGAYRDMSTNYPTVIVEGSLHCSDGWVDLPTPTTCELRGTNAIIGCPYSGNLLNGYTSAKTAVRVILSDEL